MPDKAVQERAMLQVGAVRERRKMV